MNDTHGDNGKGWYGFDLDGTLAKYDTWKGIDHIGDPVKTMVDLIKKLHAEGQTVKIVTARVAPRRVDEIETMPNPHGIGNVPDYSKELVAGADTSFYDQEKWTASNFISDWCMKNLGFLPEIVYQKDHLMITLYDDRVKQVETNTGCLIETGFQRACAAADEAQKAYDKIYNENLKLELRFSAKRWSWQAAYMLGMLVTSILFISINVIADHFRDRTPQQEAVERLLDAAKEAQEALR